MLALGLLWLPEAWAQNNGASFADAKYVEMGKKGLEALARGDVKGWVEGFADDARYYFNGGDSIIGKAAITQYWTDRRQNVLGALSFRDYVFLPVDVHTPQANELPGVWLLGWYQATATYKATGKTMTQWLHSLMHYNADGKIDQVIHFIDRAPINAAMQ